MIHVEKMLPWVLLVMSLLGWGGTWLHQSNQIHQQSAEIRIVTAKIEQRESEASRKITELEKKIIELAADANKKLAAANQRYDELSVDASQNIELAAQKLEHESLSETTVMMAFRKAMVVSGYVAKISNVAGGTIAIGVDIKRPSSGESKFFSVTLDAGRYKEIGGLEGWAFVQGDAVTISQGGHKSKSFVVP